jgi:GMP synthase-like glutamine amidotransferase
MRIGIFQAAPENPALTPKHGSEADNFIDLLAVTDSSLTFRIYYSLAGESPDHVDDCDAYLITGSPHGVYDQLDYMHNIGNFAHAAVQKKPFIGVCFGHQLLAHAFGGKVEKSDKGWGVGIHRYEITDRPDWLDLEINGLQTIAMHQDQVTFSPPGAKVIAGSSFCPNGLLQFAENVLTLQTHPEMKEGKARDLIDIRSEKIGAAKSAEALKSLEYDNEAELIARVFLKFLNSR